MIYEFKSMATGTVVMTQRVGDLLLELIGKTPGPQGIITVDQMPAAISTLEAAVARERSAGKAPVQADEEGEEPAEPMVTLGQRAFPFIDMLRAAAAAKRDITWGV